MDVNGVLMHGTEMEIFLAYFRLPGVNKIPSIKEFNIPLNEVS